MNPFSDSVHRQAPVSGSSNQQQPASHCVMHERSCGKLQRSDCADVEESLLNGKRDREFGSVSTHEQERFLSERHNLHDYLDGEARRVLQGESITQRKLREAEMERDRMIWDKRNSEWAAMYGMNSQLGSQKEKILLGTNEKQVTCFRKTTSKVHTRTNVRFRTTSNIFAMYNQKFSRDRVTLSYQRLRKMVRPHFDQSIRTRNFKARNRSIGQESKRKKCQR